MFSGTPGIITHFHSSCSGNEGIFFILHFPDEGSMPAHGFLGQFGISSFVNDLFKSLVISLFGC